MVIIAGIVVSDHWETSEYAITPGDATLVAPLVKIHGVATNPHNDSIMLADVFLSQLTVWQRFTINFQKHVQLVPGAALVDPGVSDAELGAQGFLEMRDAKQAAEVTAFRTLGWTVPATPSGAVVNAVLEHSPAAAVGLHVGDQIVGVNGTAVSNSCSLIHYVHALKPGTNLKLRVNRVSIATSGTLSWKKTSTVNLVTATVPEGLAPSSCPNDNGVETSWLGVALEDDVSYQLPATVSIDTAGIGGPSAGLAMTLSLINKLSHGSLTGHHVVAVTGTISANGDVGPVGGVEEKAVAVHNAGASYFIVPIGDGNVAGARAADQPGLKILGVSTLRQALRDLRRFGGVKPTALTKPS